MLIILPKKHVVNRLFSYNKNIGANPIVIILYKRANLFY
jgi:hypothetical protein